MVISWPPIVTRRFDFATFSFKDSAFKEAEEKAKLDAYFAEQGA